MHQQILRYLKKKLIVIWTEVTIIMLDVTNLAFIQKLSNIIILLPMPNITTIRIFKLKKLLVYWYNITFQRIFSNRKYSSNCTTVRQ